MIMMKRPAVISEKIKRGPRSIRKRRISLINVLPIDIIKEILLCLSAEEIVKIRLVCKLFAQLTWQPSFISEHMKRHNFDASTSLIVSIHASPNLCIHRGLKKMTRLKEDFNSSQPDYYQHLKTFLKTPKIFGTCPYNLEAACEGLLCFRKRKQQFDFCNDKTIASFIVGNPITREWMSVSLPMQNENVMVLGFYFHTTSGKYKLLLQYGKFYERAHGLSYAVLELVPNILRPINYSITCHPVNGQALCHGPVLIHGNLHWFGHQGDSTFLSRRHRLMVYQIVVFNIEKEQFSQIPMRWGFSLASAVRLFEFEGKLCIVRPGPVISSSITSMSTMVVWVLEDYENGGCIEKKAVIKSGLCDPSDIQEQTYKFLVCSNFGQLILVKPGSDGTEFTFYYKKMSDEIDFQIPYTPKEASVLFAQKYNETLASMGMQRRMLKQPSDSC